MTHEIDQQLNQAASSLSAEWWKPPELTPNMSQVDLMSRVISAMSQIIHYNLLTILHMPFLHMATTDHRFDQSKTTCLFACREVLARFVSFRRVVNVVFCCRWVDFTAFTASMTILLAHLTFPQQRSEWMLAHQRQSDRALVERAMETMDMLNALNGDELSKQTAVTVRKLLQLEESSLGVGDTFRSSMAEDDNPRIEEDFCLDVPYFGTVSLSRHTSPATSLGQAPPTWSQRQSSSSSQASDRVTTSTRPMSHPGVPPSSTAALLETSQMMSQHSLQGMVANPEIMVPCLQPYQLNYESVYSTSDGVGPQADLVMTDLMASGDEWAFQGVDAAFFENFLPAQPRTA